MAGKEEYRIFVGGLAWDVTERQLETAFARFGKVHESQMGYIRAVFVRWLQQGCLVLDCMDGTIIKSRNNTVADALWIRGVRCKAAKLSNLI